MELKQFWESQARSMFRAVFPISLGAAEESMRVALGELEILTGSSFSTEFINEMAHNLAGQATLQFVQQVTSTSIALFREIAEDWIATGGTLEELIERLIPIFGETRANAIAITEITRLYAQANIEAWRSTGVVEGKRLMTAEDELVCPICGPVDSEEVGLDEVFSTGDQHPPFHVRCRCWVNPVL